MDLTQAVAPTLDEICRTADEIRPFVLTTPIHEWDGREISELAPPSTSIVAKLELFQHSGTFKARGAIASMLALNQEQLAKGVTAISAGNHAIATAYAAHRLGTTAKVVMLASADPARVSRARAYGAEVLTAATGAEGFALAQSIAEVEERSLIHPFEGPRVALATGTLGLEFWQQAGHLDAVIVPIGGGGLCAGVSTAIKTLSPTCKIFGVEPIGADTMSRSFREGTPQSRNDVATIADSLAPPYALPYSFALCRRFVDKLVLVDDQQIIGAMALLFRELKLAVEPAAAAATAALLGPLCEELRGKRVGLIMCGANISIQRFSQFVQQGIENSGVR